MRTLAMFIAVIVSMLVVLVVVNVYDWHFNRHPADTALSNTNADNDSSMTTLCETYRKWQALPEINQIYTGMDAICTKMENGKP
jgi:hypothetical protein